MNDDEPEDTIEGRILAALEDARAPRVRASELAAYLETSRGAVRTGLQSLADTDRVVRHTDGPRALWSLPDRADEPDPLATDDIEAPDPEESPETDTGDAPPDDADATDEEDGEESETAGDDDATEGSNGVTDDSTEDEPVDDDPTGTPDEPTEETPDPGAAATPSEPPATPRPDAETAPDGPGRQGVVVALALLAVVAVLLRRRLRGR